MLVGAALRGCVVLVISPALKNAPSPGAPQMSRANELFTRFVVIQDEMSEEIRAAGGLFKTGVYSMDIDVGDVIGKVQRIKQGVAQSSEFQRLFPFDTSVFQLLAKLPALLEAEGFVSGYRSGDTTKRAPKLHLKSQFFASERAINTLVPMEHWKNIVSKYFLARARQTRARDAETDPKGLRADLDEDAKAVIAAWRAGMTPQEQAEVIFYLTIGSHNQNSRSLIMDGEVMYVIARIYAIVAYLDFISIIGQTTWVENVGQLEELLPRHTGFKRWLGRFLKLAL
jgi:hypothetical protein